jgi:hypothetical protein
VRAEHKRKSEKKWTGYLSDNLCRARVHFHSLIAGARSWWAPQPVPVSSNGENCNFSISRAYTSRVTARKKQLIDFSRDFFSLPRRHYNCQQYITFNHFPLYYLSAKRTGFSTGYVFLQLSKLAYRLAGGEKIIKISTDIFSVS